MGQMRFGSQWVIIGMVEMGTWIDLKQSMC